MMNTITDQFQYNIMRKGAKHFLNKLIFLIEAINWSELWLVISMLSKAKRFLFLFGFFFSNALTWSYIRVWKDHL